MSKVEVNDTFSTYFNRLSNHLYNKIEVLKKQKHLRIQKNNEEHAIQGVKQ